MHVANYLIMLSNNCASTRCLLVWCISNNYNIGSPTVNDNIDVAV